MGATGGEGGLERAGGGGGGVGLPYSNNVVNSPRTCLFQKTVFHSLDMCTNAVQYSVKIWIFEEKALSAEKKEFFKSRMFFNNKNNCSLSSYEEKYRDYQN